MEEDIIAALPLLRKQGVPLYIHAELPDETQLQVILVKVFLCFACKASSGML